MSHIAELDKRLNDMILGGKMMEAFEEFYADDVTMQENHDAPCVGKAANREREKQFMASVEAVHGGQVVATGHGGEHTFNEWDFEMTMKGMGRIKMQQVSVRTWKNGKVVYERFYHKQ